VLDARRCLAWLLQAPGVFPREYRAALGDRIYGCDECQEACPANRSSTKAQRAGSSGGDGGRPVVVPPARPVDEERDVDVLTVLNASDSQLLSSYGRWYIADRSPRYLRRNALIVLGNVGDGCSPAVEAVLRSYLVHADELLRAHAVWAAARAGRQDLVDEVWNDLAGDPSSLVRGELALIGDVPRAHTASASLRH
jgi:epoxyqueuosine reductase